MKVFPKLVDYDVMIHIPKLYVSARFSKLLIRLAKRDVSELQTGLLRVRSSTRTRHETGRDTTQLEREIKSRYIYLRLLRQTLGPSAIRA